MGLLSLVDHYFFAFHPLQKNIFIDQGIGEQNDRYNIFARAQNLHRSLLGTRSESESNNQPVMGAS